MPSIFLTKSLGIVAFYAGLDYFIGIPILFSQLCVPEIIGIQPRGTTSELLIAKVLYDFESLRDSKVRPRFKGLSI